MSIILRTKRLRQEECSDLGTSLDYIDLSHHTQKRALPWRSQRVDTIFTTK